MQNTQKIRIKNIQVQTEAFIWRELWVDVNVLAADAFSLTQIIDMLAWL